MEKHITILNTINQLFNLEENEGRLFTFDEIYKTVESSLEAKWIEKNSKGINKATLLENKTGEVYKLLTLDGRFIRHEDGTWSKRKINEAF